MPRARQLSGISFVTTEPAPIITFFPKLTLGSIVAFDPICEKSPTVTFPNKIAFGDNSTKCPILQS